MQDVNQQLNLQLQTASDKQKAYDNRCSENESYKNKCQQQETEILELSDRLALSMERVQNLEQMVEERDDQIRELQNTCVKYEMEVESLQETLSKTNSEKKEKVTFSTEEDDMLFNDDMFEETNIQEPETFQFGTNILTDVLEIKENETSVKKQSNFLAELLLNYQKKRFEKLPEQEQIGQINIKLIRNKYSKDLMKLITTTLGNKNGISKLALYEMISKKAAEDKIIRYCKAYV